MTAPDAPRSFAKLIVHAELAASWSLDFLLRFYFYESETITGLLSQAVLMESRACQAY